MTVLANQMLVPLVQKPRFEAELFQFGNPVATVGIDARRRFRLDQVREPPDGILDAPDSRLDAPDGADDIGSGRDGLLRHSRLYSARQVTRESCAPLNSIVNPWTLNAAPMHANAPIDGGSSVGEKWGNPEGNAGVFFFTY